MRRTPAMHRTKSTRPHKMWRWHSARFRFEPWFWTEPYHPYHRVLHTPTIGCTLVLVATLDEEGYHVHIGTGHLKLTSLQGKHIGHIPWTQGRLYKIINATKPMSIMELHRHLSYIAPLTARKLVNRGAIVGVKLNPDFQETNCESLWHLHICVCYPSINF